MTFVHGFAARGDGGVDGIQSDQRDWSPFVAHFTSWGAMKDVRSLHAASVESKKAKETLQKADESSFSVFEKIVASTTLKASKPSGKNKIPDCVCFSECSLPGLLSHTERYGRFGFVFRKRELFVQGARPCCYVDNQHYKLVIESKGVAAHPHVVGLYNKYVPVNSKAPPQDYTHEREWRHFAAVSLVTTVPCAIVVPADRWIEPARKKLQDAKLDVPMVLSLDTLFQWGV